MRPRLLVASPPPLPGEPPLSSGSHWVDDGPSTWLVLIVKAAFDYRAGSLAAVDFPAVFRADAPSDFVPPKDDAEVILRADRASARIDGSIEVDGIATTLSAIGAEPALRLPVILPGARVVMVDLSPTSTRTAFELPDLVPRAVLEAEARPAAALALACDTLFVDTDREVIEMVWRGAMPVQGTVERALLWWSRAGAPRDHVSAERQLAGGWFRFAVEERDLAAGSALGARERAALLRARHAAWSGAVEPTMSVERYAAIEAELQEKREARAETLRRHGLREEAWTVEERAQAEALADGARRGDLARALGYGEAFLAAQDRLAAPEEAARTLDDYLPLKAAMARGADPALVLADARMTLPVWMRLDRRFTALALEDAAVARAIDRAVAASLETANDDEALDLDEERAAS